MFSETTAQLLDASKKISELRVELEQIKKKKEPMCALNYRFKKETKTEIEDLALNLSSVNRKWTESDVARAAMYLGIKQIMEVYEHSQKQANGLMHVIKLREKFQK